MAITKPPMEQPFFDGNQISVPWWLWFTAVFNAIQDNPVSSVDDLNILEAFTQDAVNDLPPKLVEALAAIASVSDVQRPTAVQSAQNLLLMWEPVQFIKDKALQNLQAMDGIIVSPDRKKIIDLQNNIDVPLPNPERKRVAELQALEAFDNQLQNPAQKKIAEIQIELGNSQANFGSVNGPSSVTSGNLAVWSGTNGRKLADGGAAPTANQKIRAPGITIDGGGAVPTTGSKGFFTFPYAATITNWYLAADVSGSCVIDIKRSGTSIVGGGGNKPTLSSAQTGNAAVSGWTSTAISAGDTLEYNLDSVSTITRVTLTLKVTAT